MLGPASFSFLNRTGDLDAVGWSGSEEELLWRYNQHYFDDLNAEACVDRRTWHEALIVRWLAENPAGTRPAWDPYPLSLRVVNWTKWLLGGGSVVPGMAQSLAEQVRWLLQSVEYQILGNHLLSNAKALAFAGVAFTGPEADRWLDVGLGILRREVAEQLLPDGGNFERSPMYHALCLEDLLDLINLAQAHPSRVPAGDAATWRTLAGQARFWLDTMTHPDGEIAQFNDAAVGIAPRPAQLHRYADDLGVSAEPGSGVRQAGPNLVWLTASGYVRATSDTAALICDVAPLGPNYLPAHGHADTLSFELSVRGQRIVVNGGTSRYGEGAGRLAERKTRAHSTVEVAGEDSSEVWGGFRVARRARPFAVSATVDKGAVMISASHDGYKRLPGSPVHRRTWRLAERSLRVQDEVLPPAPAIARFVADPAFAVRSTTEGGFDLGGVAMLHADCGIAAIEPSHHGRRFGARQDTVAVAVALADGRAATRIVW